MRVGISIHIGRPSEVKALLDLEPVASQNLLPRNKITNNLIRLVAYDDETKELYGFLECEMGGINCKNFYTSHAGILNLLVIEKARNYGVAEKLIRNLFTREAVKNRTLILFCPRKSPATIALAEKCGFKYSSNDDNYNCYVKTMT